MNKQITKENRMIPPLKRWEVKLKIYLYILTMPDREEFMLFMLKLTLTGMMALLIMLVFGGISYFIYSIFGALF